MAITKYTGQPLPEGTIVCRESVMAFGICSRPGTVVRETELMVELRDQRDPSIVVRRKKDSILFICDTEEDGMRMYEESLRIVDEERRISRQHEAERTKRRLEAIEAVIGEH